MTGGDRVRRCDECEVSHRAQAHAVQVQSDKAGVFLEMDDATALLEDVEHRVEQWAMRMSVRGRDVKVAGYTRMLETLVTKAIEDRKRSQGGRDGVPANRRR